MKEIALPKMYPAGRRTGTFTFSPAKTVFFLFLLFISLVCSAGNKADTIYVDEYMRQADSEKAAFFIIKEGYSKKKGIHTWYQHIYQSGGILKSTCQVSAKGRNDRNPVKNGIATEYFTDGIIKSQVEYKDGKRNGSYTEYYSNGSLKTSGKILNGRMHVHHFLDSSGKDQLLKGNGLMWEFDTTFKYKTYSQVRDSIKGHAFYIDSLLADTVYTTTASEIRLTTAVLNAGKALVISDLPYDKVKRHLGKKLYTICTLDENGKVISVRKKNSIHDEVDSLLLERVKILAEFTPPSLENGRRVKAAVIIPLMI